jgi:hypothetical protein
VLSLLEITLIGIAVWVTFVTGILCLLKAARIADDSDPRELLPASPAAAPRRRAAYGPIGAPSARH